jgi:hypothetical protein
MKKQFLLLMIVSLICQNSISQETENQIRRNLIKGTIASSGIANSMMSIDYERNIINTELIKFNIEGTFGKFFRSYTLDSFQSYPGFPSITSSVNSLLGKKSNFLEVSLGVRYSIIKDDYYKNINPLFPVFNIGYRYQNYYKSGIIFRVFIGATGVGLSTGIAF